MVKCQQMVSNVFAVDQAVWAYDIYLIYACVGATEADARGHIKSTKKKRFRNFFEILGVSLQIPSTSNSRC